MLNLFLRLVVLTVAADAYVGPKVIASKGEVWPKPQKETKTNEYFVIKPHTFSFKRPENTNCPNLLNDAFTRYLNIIVNSESLEKKRGLLKTSVKNKSKDYETDDNYLGYLDALNVEFGNCTEDSRPEFNDDESYTITINKDTSSLTANTIWGVLRGLETFSQLIYSYQDFLLINATTINDFPRFSHRGLLLDTSRHYLPVHIILQTLDAMAYNKFNVFHWHIVDDQSFPYKSVVYPRLSDLGAYHHILKIYNQTDIKKIVEYARVRGIRVIPEFDTPDHTLSWGVGYPELLTECYTDNYKNGHLGPMDPTKNSTYTFLANLFAEVVKLFPDSYFHIGGDELDFYCWRSNPNIKEFMKKNNMKSFKQLEIYFFQHVVNILNNLNSKYVVWEEVFIDGVKLPKSALVHVWRGDGHDTIASVTKAGMPVIYSGCWYLDQHVEGHDDWETLYECEALDFYGDDNQKKLVLGGEACMWAEWVNEYNIMPRVWPRASAVIEKLWSDISVRNPLAARPRLEEHTCRMNQRGIAAQPPNGPGVCL